MVVATTNSAMETTEGDEGITIWIFGAFIEVKEIILIY